MKDRNYHRDYSRNYYHKKRQEYIAILGGRCVKCGTEEKLQFDHIDPSTKKFPLGKMLNRKKAEALEEIKKCQLLCHPCHIDKTREQTYGRSIRLVTEPLLKSVEPQGL